MTRLFLAIILFILCNPVFAQIQAPDYRDVSKWTYYDCGEEFLAPKEENMAAFHEDYRPADLSDENNDLIVVYRPISIEIYEKDGEEKFRELSKTQPWLMLNIVENSVRDETIHLFEYDGNSWKHVLSSSENEMMDFLDKQYGLH